MKPISDIYNVDCMEYMKSVPDKFFDLAVVDPPYGINAPSMNMGSNMTRTKGGYPSESTASRLKRGRLNSGAGKLKGRVLNTMRCDWDFFPPEKEYFSELFRVSVNQIIWGGNYFPLPPSRGIICWDKMQPWDNFSQFELAWTSFDRPAAMFRYSNTGGRNSERKIHPTQKPVALYAWIFKNFVSWGAKILDTHLGSGSSRIAAYKMRLDFWGCEIDEEYFKASDERFRKECLGIEKINDTVEIIQQSLF